MQYGRSTAEHLLGGIHNCPKTGHFQRFLSISVKSEKMETTPSISADFPFESNFIEVDGFKIHYVDQGSGEPILFLHGNPTSSYLWRNIIPYLTAKGRCLAPDLIGMGKSDKPDIDYLFFDHVKFIEGFIERMNLKNITLVMHDWGSAIGFHYAMSQENNIKGLAFMEFIRPMSWDDFPTRAIELFKAFRTPEVGWDLLVNKNAFIEQVLPLSIVRQLSEEEMNRYREPFQKINDRKPIWRWPNEIPIEGEPVAVVKAVETYHAKLLQSDLPKLMFYADPGALISPSMAQWYEQHLKNLKSVNIGAGSHYLQEDNPHLIGAELVNWYNNL
ncbi:MULTISPECIES: haloalkane dehalogenase [unclassified Microcystis]|nr:MULTISPECIES: haloalkane dehalogenase [unclassified Microcystis]